MKINRLLLPEGKEIIFDEDVDFSLYPGDKYHIRKINKCHALVKVRQYEDLLILDFHIKGEVITSCAYTLEDVIYPIDIKEIIELNGEEDDEFIFEGDIIDLDPVILTLIISSVPMKVIKEGAKLPSSGDGYRFYTEDEKKEKPSPFDVLDDLE